MNAQEIQGRWDQLRGRVKEKWGQLTDEDLHIVGGNLDQLIGTIERKTGEARENVEQFLDELVAGSTLHRVKETVMGYGESAMNAARESMEQVGGQARQQFDNAGQIVQRRPVESLAVVFGLGFVTGLALGAMICSDD